VSSVVHVPGRADKYMTTATACNKGIGLILRVMFPLTRAEHVKLKDWGFVAVPTFNSLNFIGKSKDPETHDSKPGDERLHECASQVNPLVFFIFSICPPLPSHTQLYKYPICATIGIGRSHSTSQGMPTVKRSTIVWLQCKTGFP
jgi:hypothetical protein